MGRETNGVEELQCYTSLLQFQGAFASLRRQLKAFIRCCVSQPPAAHNAQPGWIENKQLPKLAAPILAASPSAQGRGRSQIGLEKGQGGGCR